MLCSGVFSVGWIPFLKVNSVVQTVLLLFSVGWIDLKLTVLIPVVVLYAGGWKGSLLQVLLGPGSIAKSSLGSCVIRNE